MSVEAITWAFAQRVGHASAKSVLVAMANCADPDMICWPSMGYLQNVTEQDRKTVIENIKRLKDRSLIAPTGARKGKTGQVVVYLLNPSKNGTVKESQNRNSTENGTVPFFPSKGPVFPAKESQKRDTEPKGTVRNRNTAHAALFALPEWVPVDSWDAWVEMRVKIKKPLTDRAKSMAIKKLQGFVDQGHAAADVLDQSTLNDWQDLYPIKADQQAKVVHDSNPWKGAV